MRALKFNTQIYKKEAIQEAILAYSSVAKFKIKNTKNYTEIKTEPMDSKLKGILADEFSNYVLGMAKKCL